MLFGESSFAQAPFASQAGQAVITVGETTPDIVETLVASTYYYRRIQAPVGITLDTVHAYFAATSGSVKITPFIYADSAGSIGAQLATGTRVTGVAQDVDSSFPLSTGVALNAGDWFWAAILVEAANVNGKSKSGEKGKKDSGGGPVDTPNASAIWATGLAAPVAFPVLAIVADISHSEGVSGTTPFVFDVTRQLVTSGATSVDWAVTGTGSNPAAASDFVGGSFPSGTLNFSAGDTIKQITVNVAGDSTSESDETFLVTLSNASGSATIGKATSIGTIANDDNSISANSASQAQAATSPSLAAKSSVSPANAAEGNAATSPSVAFTPGGITPNNGAHAQAATSPTIGAKSVTAPASASLSQASSQPTLAAKASVTPNSASEAQAAAQPLVTPKFTGQPDDAAQAQTASSPSVASKAAIAPSSTTEAQASTSPSITAKSAVSPANAAQAHAAGSPSVVYTVVIDSAAQAQASTVPTVTVHFLAFPDDASQAHAATVAQVANRLLPSEASLDRRLTIPGVLRSSTVAGVARGGFVAGVSRLSVAETIDREGTA